MEHFSKNTKKITVVMPSYLGFYEGCASNRKEKFLKAVNSFINQSYPNKELIIISDGCKDTNELYASNFSAVTSINLIKINKQDTFSGNVRQIGIEQATGDIICYLDSDDFIGTNHLSIIADNFKDNDWVYYSDYIWNGVKEIKKNTKLAHGSIGTSSIAHKSNLGISWEGCNGYGHDFKFISKLIKRTDKYAKIFGASYYICHIPNILDVN